MGGSRGLAKLAHDAKLTQVRNKKNISKGISGLFIQAQMFVNNDLLDQLIANQRLAIRYYLLFAIGLFALGIAVMGTTYMLRDMLSPEIL